VGDEIFRIVQTDSEVHAAVCTMIPVPFRPNLGVDHPPPSAGLRSGWLYTPDSPLCVRNYGMG
jgi:hypothetical protein